jgi:ATP-dependent Clp protease ATP-binding subunit ClpA
MFERFTTEARQVVVLAQLEARNLRDPFIDGAHLLLGIATVAGPGSHALQAVGVDVSRIRTAIAEVGDPSSLPLDAEALTALGIDLSRVQAAAEAAFGAGALNDQSGRRRRRPEGHLPFTATSKKALELSLRAALAQGDRSIDSRHVLLGVLDAGDKRATAVLHRLEVDTADLRRRLRDQSDAA